MKKTAILLLFLLPFMMFSDVLQRKSKKLNIPERHEKWLEEEVVYIISAIEREVFLQLQSDRERDLFIEVFWAQRDPTKGDSENEYKKEHYRRINYANHALDRATPKAGWRTDRGRMYIILGEPNDIVRFEGKSQVYNTEVWFYQGLSKIGLPPGFNLVFYQQGGIGEYRLYSPLSDGPMALMTSYFGDQLDHMSAYQKLRELEPELASVSLTLIPGEGPDISGRPSMTSDLLIQRIETSPGRMIKDKYAQIFLEFKDIVEVEYSANYMDNDALIKIIKDSSGFYFVHYAIEPERLSVNQFEDKYFTTLKLNGAVSDLEGRTIHQFEKDIRLEFDQDQIQQVSQKPLSIRDMFPLIPGTYTVSILIKNEVSKEFTSIERTVFIPGEKDGLQLTSLLMGYSKRVNPTPEKRLRPFQMGDNQIYFQANRVFVMKDELVLIFQIHGLTQELKDRGEIKYTFFKDREEFQTLTKEMADYEKIPDFIEQVSLNEFYPAHYQLKVALWIDKEEVLNETDEFDVTHSESIPRPWIYSQLLAATDDPVYSYVIGQQYVNSGNSEAARGYLENAHSKMTDNVLFAVGLSRIYAAQKQYTKILPLLEPLMKLPESSSFDVHFILGRSYQELEEFQKAIDIFDRALEQFGINTLILNALGVSYFRLANSAEALAAWEKSLEMNPDQPEIQKNIKAIKEKK